MLVIGNIDIILTTWNMLDIAFRRLFLFLRCLNVFSFIRKVSGFLPCAHCTHSWVMGCLRSNLKPLAPAVLFFGCSSPSEGYMNCSELERNCTLLVLYVLGKLWILFYNLSKLIRDVCIGNILVSRGCVMKSFLFLVEHEFLGCYKRSRSFVEEVT